MKLVKIKSKLYMISKEPKKRDCLCTKLKSDLKETTGHILCDYCYKEWSEYKSSRPTKRIKLTKEPLCQDCDEPVSDVTIRFQGRVQCDECKKEAMIAYQESIMKQHKLYFCSKIK